MQTSSVALAGLGAFPVFTDAGVKKTAMNNIEGFLNDCANDPYFRVHPEKLDVVRSTIAQLCPSGYRNAWAQLGLERIHEIAAQTDRTPRQRCKELFPLLLRVLEHQDLDRDGDPNATHPEESETSVPAGDSEISVATRSLLASLWILQGRVSALELITMEAVEEIARLHSDSVSYMMQFAGRARARLTCPVPGGTELSVRERDIAFEEFLTAMRNNIAGLKRVE
jgi:hypothetical protein